MQVIIFDKFFKCIYRLRNIPNHGHFDDVAKALELSHSYNEYQAIRLADSGELCIDDYTYKDDKLILTCSSCE